MAIAIVVDTKTASPVLTNVAKGDPSVFNCLALNTGIANVTATGLNMDTSKDNNTTWQPSNLPTGLTAASNNIKNQKQCYYLHWPPHTKPSHIDCTRLPNFLSCS